MKKLSGLIALILIISLIITPSCAEDLKFKVNSSKTAFAEGGYDVNAVMPANSAWSRVSRFAGADDPQLLWAKYDDVYEHMVIGKNNVIYLLKQDSENLGEDASVYYLRLFAIDNTGKTLWTFELKNESEQFYPSDLVIGLDGTIYFTSETYNEKNHTIHTLYAVKQDGKLKWKYEDDTYSAETTPVIDSKGSIYVGGDYWDNQNVCQGFVLKIDQKGKAVVFTKIRDAMIKSIVPGADGTIYIMLNVWSNVTQRRNQGYLYAVGQDKKTKWKFKLDSYEEFSSDTVIGADKTVYFTSNRKESGKSKGNLRAVGPNGKKVWTYDIGDIVYTNPVIADNGNIVIASGHDTDGVYFSWRAKLDDKNLGRLSAINKNGKVVWSKDLKHGFAVTPIIDSRGNIYIADISGKYMSFDTKGKLLWSQDSGEEISWGSFCMDSNGTLYGCSYNNFSAVGNKTQNNTEQQEIE